MTQRALPVLLQLAFTQMKSRIYLFLGNAKAANREAKSALVLAADGAAQPAVVERTCLQAHFAKAHLELARGNGGKARTIPGSGMA